MSTENHDDKKVVFGRFPSTLQQPVYSEYSAPEASFEELFRRLEKYAPCLSETDPKERNIDVICIAYYETLHNLISYMQIYPDPSDIEGWMREKRRLIVHMCETIPNDSGSDLHIFDSAIRSLMETY